MFYCALGGLRESNGNSADKTGFIINLVQDTLSLNVPVQLVCLFMGMFMKNTCEPDPQTRTKTLPGSYTYLQGGTSLIPFFYHPQNVIHISTVWRVSFLFAKVSLDEQRTSFILLHLNLSIFPLTLVFLCLAWEIPVVRKITVRIFIVVAFSV